MIFSFALSLCVCFFFNFGEEDHSIRIAIHHSSTKMTTFAICWPHNNVVQMFMRIEDENERFQFRKLKRILNDKNHSMFEHALRFFFLLFERVNRNVGPVWQCVCYILCFLFFIIFILFLFYFIFFQPEKKVRSFLTAQWEINIARSYAHSFFGWKCIQNDQIHLCDKLFQS